MTYYAAIKNGIVLYCGSDYKDYSKSQYINNEGIIFELPSNCSKRLISDDLPIGTIYNDYIKYNKITIHHDNIFDPKLKLYQIYYSEDTNLYRHADPKQVCFKQAILYDNSNKVTPFFENIPIRDILLENVNNTDYEYISILSWKFKQKMSKGYEYIKTKTTGDLNIMWKNVQIGSPIIIANRNSNHHPGMIDLANEVNKKLFKNKLNFNKKVKFGYCNYWVMKREMANKYVTEFLEPCIELMEKDEEVFNLANRPTNYVNHSNLPKSELMRMYKQPHVTFHTFFLERMVSIMVDHFEGKIS